MIVVEAKLIPFGDFTAPSTTLCRLEIINDGTGTSTHGNYRLRLYSKGVSPRLLKKGRIDNWPRKSKAAWRLIAEAFKIMELS